MSERGSSRRGRGGGGGGGRDQGRIRPRSPPRHGREESRERYMDVAPTRRREEPWDARNVRESTRNDSQGMQECASRFGTRDVHMYTKVRQIGQGAYGFVNEQPFFPRKEKDSRVVGNRRVFQAKYWDKDGKECICALKEVQAEFEKNGVCLALVFCEVGALDTEMRAKHRFRSRRSAR